MPEKLLGVEKTWAQEAQEYQGQVLTVRGGRPLWGVVESPGGGKNVAGKILIASCLGSNPSTITNVPAIGEVRIGAEMLAGLGVELEFSNEGTKISVDPASMQSRPIPTELGTPSRSSIVALGMLLAATREANIPLPGGDKLGSRPVEVHIRGMQELGAQKLPSPADRIIMVANDGLHGTELTMKVASVTGTETLSMAATKATGTTVIHNANLMSEVWELLGALNKAGAKIEPRGSVNNIGALNIVGTNEITSIDHELDTDLNAVITYGVAALITDSEQGILVKRTKPHTIKHFLKLLDAMGGGYEVKEDGILFYSKGTLKAPERTIVASFDEIDTEEYLSIKADWQPLVSLLLLKAEGTSQLIETVFAERFQHLEVARRAGAAVQYFDPREQDQSIYYHFQEDQLFHGVRITGGKKLSPIDIDGSNDIRLAAFCLLMGLMSPGESHISNLTQVKRGYHNLIENLQEIGADIRIS